MSFKRSSRDHLHSSQDPFSSVESFLILERSLEQSGQRYIENQNVIEQFLISTAERIRTKYSDLESTFIIRRLPTFTAPFANSNEYAVVLDNFDFTLSSPLDPRRRSTTDRVGIPNFGQTEIFHPNKEVIDAYHADHASKDSDSTKGQGEAEVQGAEQTENVIGQLVNAKYAYRSHEVFKRFANSFLDASNADLAEPLSANHRNDTRNASSNRVQIIGPHLLHDVKCGPEVKNILKLIQSEMPLKGEGNSRCVVSVNHLKSFISISYEDTVVTVKPCLFLDKGYARVHVNLTERIPFYHSCILNIGQSLTKGCLVFPTSFETLWTLQFWPQESHIICTYHPNSIVSRLLKLHAGFCLNPANFWETLNNNFLIGVEDLTWCTETKGSFLNLDYAISSFLYELENFCQIEDWAPRNFATRLIHLLRSTVDSYEKGFHSHYFTKINVLRAIWKNNLETFGKEEKSVLKELDDIEESPEDTVDYCDRSIDDFDDDFGFFDPLDTNEESQEVMLTSDMVYKSVNPFQSLENITTKGLKEGHKNEDRKKPATLSKMFGSTLLRKFGSKLSRSKSDAGLPEPMNELKKPKSMMDIASGFEESVAHMRRDKTPLQKNFVSEESLSEETTLTTPIAPQRKIRSCSIPQAGTSSSTNLQFGYENEGLQLPADSIYSSILQIVSDLPPSDHCSDLELLAYLDSGKRKLESQEELITSWCRIMEELPKPKIVCPHQFSPRQVQYLSLVIRIVSQSSPGINKSLKHAKLPSWEISGDILKTILHQMRSEITEKDSDKEKRLPIKKFSFKIKRSLSDNPKTLTKKERSGKFSFRKGNADICKNHDISVSNNMNTEDSVEADTELALEDPETAATKRMLSWLWQLRNSEIGRLSSKANKYIEKLYTVSLVNSHFLDQFSEQKIIQNLAIRSAVAVSRIIADEKFPAHVPLMSASKKGWAWAEMILSLSSWNREKGFRIQAEVAIEESKMQREIDYVNYSGTIKKEGISGDPDSDAVSLAFHSELATPIGWNDFEDPRRPGPYTVPILIYSTQYFNLWEVIPGNIVHILLRLKKFNSLQHVGSMLLSPHRKTALNEVRKLNKSLSFRSYHYDDNVMSKTFKRLASLRATRQLFSVKSRQEIFGNNRKYTCREIGCSSFRNESETATIIFHGREFECTKI